MSERATPQQPPRLPGLWTLLRDVGSFLGGWALIFMEAQRPDIRESILAFAGSIIATPGLAVGATAIAEAIRGRRNGTDVSPSEPQPEASSSSP